MCGGNERRGGSGNLNWHLFKNILIKNESKILSHMWILEFNLQNFMINMEDLLMSGSRKRPMKSET